MRGSPLKARGYTLKHAEVVEKIRAGAGEWVLVGNRPSTYTARNLINMIERAESPVYEPAGSFQAEARLGDPDYEVWARTV